MYDTNLTSEYELKECNTDLHLLQYHILKYMMENLLRLNLLKYFLGTLQYVQTRQTMYV